jgi:hypothetical protein
MKNRALTEINNSDIVSLIRFKTQSSEYGLLTRGVAQCNAPRPQTARNPTLPEYSKEAASP